MKFSGKICFKVILKVTKNQGFSIFLEDTLSEKPQGEGQVEHSPPSPPAVLGLSRPLKTHQGKSWVFDLTMQVDFVLRTPVFIRVI